MQPVLTSAVTILALDAIWLTINKTYHEKLFRNVQKSPMELRYIPAVFVYILMSLAVSYFAILPSKSILESFQKGALWGTFVCSIASMVGYYFK